MARPYAVIEQIYGKPGQWRTLAEVGPGRPDQIIEALDLYRGGSIRIRYLTPQEFEHDAPGHSDNHPGGPED